MFNFSPARRVRGLHTHAAQTPGRFLPDKAGALHHNDRRGAQVQIFQCFLHKTPTGVVDRQSPEQRSPIVGRIRFLCQLHQFGQQSAPTIKMCDQLLLLLPLTLLSRSAMYSRCFCRDISACSAFSSRVISTWMACWCPVRGVHGNNLPLYLLDL